MTDVRQTRLPGVGVRHDFDTSSGRRVGVIVHHSGRRELLVYDEADPDLCRDALRIDEHEAHALAEMLGATRVTATVDEIRQSVEGLSIDWLDVGPVGGGGGATIGELALRQRTGVTIIAILRDGETVPSPGAGDRLEEGDTAVVVGLPEQIPAAVELLEGR